MNEPIKYPSPACYWTDDCQPEAKLSEVESILSELDLYLYRNPEDEIARLQYEQYDRKRRALSRELTPVFGGYAAGSDGEAEGAWSASSNSDQL